MLLVSARPHMSQATIGCLRHVRCGVPGMKTRPCRLHAQASPQPQGPLSVITSWALNSSTQCAATCGQLSMCPAHSSACRSSSHALRDVAAAHLCTRLKSRMIYHLQSARSHSPGARGADTQVGWVNLKLQGQAPTVSRTRWRACRRVLPCTRWQQPTPPLSR